MKLMAVILWESWRIQISSCCLFFSIFFLKVSLLVLFEVNKWFFQERNWQLIHLLAKDYVFTVWYPLGLSQGFKNKTQRVIFWHVQKIGTANVCVWSWIHGHDCPILRLHLASWPVGQSSTTLAAWVLSLDFVFIVLSSEFLKLSKEANDCVGSSKSDCVWVLSTSGRYSRHR